MNNDAVTRLLAWLQRHPLKRPPSTTRAAYTDEVMARVRASAPVPVFQWVPRPTEAAPSPLPSECRSRLGLRPTAAALSSLLRPRMAFGFGATVAFGMAALMLTHRAPARVANDPVDSSQVLAALGELDGVSGNDLEDEVAALDRLVLAEADTSTDDDAWVQETMELLHQVEDAPAQASPEESLEELLQELDSLDEREIANS